MHARAAAAAALPPGARRRRRVGAQAKQSAAAARVARGWAAIAGVGGCRIRPRLSGGRERGDER